MKSAYVVLSGGGAKGVALAGCLSALDVAGIRPVGFGGCSAGAIIASLAAAGMTAEEISQLAINDIDFETVLDADSPAIEGLPEFAAGISRALTGWLPPAIRLRPHRHVYSKLRDQLGLHSASRFEASLDAILREKLRRPPEEPITFQNLVRFPNTLPLRILTTDVIGRRPVIFGTLADDEKGPIVSAVRASMAYPLAFHPVRVHKRVLVDGGLCSNMPVFLFQDEHLRTGLPIIAFDLVSAPKFSEVPSKYPLDRFLKDLLATSVEASEHVLLRVAKGVTRVPIRLDPSYETLRFKLSEAEKKALFAEGMAQGISGLMRNKSALSALGHTSDMVAALRVEHGPIEIFEPPLRAIRKIVEEKTMARGVRSQIMLPLPSGRRIVAYSSGMEADPDQQLHLSRGGGCTGQAFTSRAATVADLDRAAQNPTAYNLTPEEQARIRKDRKAMIAIPLTSGSNERRDDPIGTLSVDSETPLDSTGWIKRLSADKVDILPGILGPLKQWERVVCRLLSHDGELQ